jgi:hypothetical protein
MMYVKRAAALRAMSAGQGQSQTTAQPSLNSDSQMRVDTESSQNVPPEVKDTAVSEATGNSDGPAGWNSAQHIIHIL